MNYEQSFKFDKDKLRYSLIPTAALRALAKILTYGANKYSDNSWQNVKPFRDRYYDALMRHLEAWRNGEIIDRESGYAHIDHAFCNMMFLACEEGKDDRTT